MEPKGYDRIIIGAGLYGLYSALKCAERGDTVAVIERDSTAFGRATYINQARVHMGYHYPRSYTTAIKSAGYFNRFVNDFGFCIHRDFDQVYAISSKYSWCNVDQFKKFCQASNIKCQEVSPQLYFNDGCCDGAFLTQEYTYDAQILKKYFLERLKEYPKVDILYGRRIDEITQKSGFYQLTLDGGQKLNSAYVLNVTYASVNQILDQIGLPKFKIKYEVCEIILCDVSPMLNSVGITVMDGPFFSIMPFGLTGQHSLTSVTFTPHTTCKGELPTFDCQLRSDIGCSPTQLANCNDCAARPTSAWPYMSQLAHKYLRPEYGFTYNHSLFSMKPILLASELDDSRPTVIRKHTESPTFISVLSGKINTVYDLDEYF